MTTPFGGHGADRAAVPGHRDEAVVPGHRDKYALVERERRFMLPGPPGEPGPAGERHITDRYLTGTRLRLRHVRGAGWPAPEYKLTQKVPAPGPGPVRGLITEIFGGSPGPQAEEESGARVAGHRFVGHDRHPVHVKTAYRCRAYPDPAQQAMLNRTFGCVRVAWNITLAARQQRYATERTATSYAQTDRALTALKKDPALAFLNEVSCVPLQQTLRHQHKAFTAFFAKRARHPRFKSRHARQSAHYTRSAFTMRGGVLRLAGGVTADQAAE